MATQISSQDVVRLLSVNQLLYTRTAPTNPVTERTQKKSYAENGAAASLTQNEHLIVNLQTGTEFIDPLQSFVVFDINVTPSTTVAADRHIYMPGSACNLIRDSQISTRSGKEMDRLEQVNILNYHKVFHESKEYSQQNLQGLMLAEVRNNPTAAELDARGGRTVFKFTAAQAGGTVTKRVMIPLKYISPIFDSQKLMPSHLARGLRVDCTLETLLNAFVSAESATPAESFSYTISSPYILTDSYRLSDSVLEYLNANFASKKTGLVYEYFSYHNTKTQTSDTSLNVEVRSSVSMAVDAFMVSRSSTTPSLEFDSLASLPIASGDRSQWRIGSHYLPNQPIVGETEHFAQMLYYQNKLRSEREDGCDFYQFVGVGAAASDVGSGVGKYPVVLSRNNILDLSGIAINNSLTLAVEANLAAGGARSVSVFLRHLRRAILFLESAILES